MIGEWYNNEIGKKLNEEYPHDFSLCDIDGLARFSYWNKRVIIYESKHKNETMRYSQKESLRILDNAIDWSKFDDMSGLYILRVIDLEDHIEWWKLNGEKVRITTFKELYDIFSGKDVKAKQ